jgi:hypothetical protein
MMNAITATLGGTVLAGIALLVTNPLYPDETFLTVHQMRYSDGQVYATRTVHGDVTVADWRVTIVGEDRHAPYCQTVPGTDINEGWSIYNYSEASETSWPLDIWVGDAGCADRLTEGNYTMFVTWTPRDGTPTVHAATKFTRK